MVDFVGTVQARDALDDFLADRVEAMPDDVRDKLREFTKDRSTVTGMVNAAERIYARRADVGPQLLELGAAIAATCGSHGFLGMDIDSRGDRMSLAMRRDSGDAAAGKLQKKADDPEALPEHLPKDEAPAPIPGKPGAPA